MDEEEAAEPSATDDRGHVDEDYRTCPVCGTNCDPEPTAVDGIGVRIAFLCSEHGLRTIVDPLDLMTSSRSPEDLARVIAKRPGMYLGGTSYDHAIGFLTGLASLASLRSAPAIGKQNQAQSSMLPIVRASSPALPKLSVTRALMTARQFEHWSLYWPRYLKHYWTPKLESNSRR